MDINCKSELKTNLEYLNSLTDPKEHKCLKDSLEKISKCTECATDDYVTIHVMGRPSETLCEVSHKTECIRLGGCKVKGNEMRYTCRKCAHKF